MDGADRDAAESEADGDGAASGRGEAELAADAAAADGSDAVAADATEADGTDAAASDVAAEPDAAEPDAAEADAETDDGRGVTDDADTIPEGTWTVAELNEEVSEVLTAVQSRFPDHVVGEVAEVGAYGFGTFFELRDLEEEHSIKCLAWRAAVEDFDHELEAGTEAVVEADVDFYPERGDTQLVVSGYWPVGESDRQRELEALRRELAEEGLFDDERKRPIPDHPACVGLVTSPSGSAREDVWSAIADRSPRTDVKLCGATVQGEAAVPSLLGAIQRLDADPEVETILLTRGGGSDVDLHCFDAEPLVRCVAACETPVVAAIGHEDDDALVEQVADQRAMTPTETGVLATTPVDHVLAELSTVERRVGEAYRSLVEDRLEDLERRVETAHERVRQRVERQVATLRRAADLEQRIDASYRALWTTQLDDLERDVETGLERARQRDERRESALRRAADLEHRVDSAYETLVESRLDELEVRVESGYRDVEAAAEIEAGAAEARRLKVAVVVLVAILVLGAIGVALFLL